MNLTSPEMSSPHQDSIPLLNDYKEQDSEVASSPPVTVTDMGEPEHDPPPYSSSPTPRAASTSRDGYTPPPPMKLSLPDPQDPRKRTLTPVAVNCCGHTDSFSHACGTLNCCASGSRVTKAFCGINLCGSESLLQKSCLGINVCASQSLLEKACCGLNCCGNTSKLCASCVVIDLCGSRSGTGGTGFLAVHCCTPGQQ